MKRPSSIYSDHAIVAYLSQYTRPVGVHQVAYRFGWCYETTARKLRALAKAGQLLQVPKAGDVAPMSGRRGPGYVKA